MIIVNSCTGYTGIQINTGSFPLRIKIFLHYYSIINLLSIIQTVYHAFLHEIIRQLMTTSQYHIKYTGPNKKYIFCIVMRFTNYSICNNKVELISLLFHEECYRRYYTGNTRRKIQVNQNAKKDPILY